MKLTPYEEQLIHQRRAKQRKRKPSRPAPKKRPSTLGFFASELVTNVLLLLLVALAILILFSGR